MSTFVIFNPCNGVPSYAWQLHRRDTWSKPLIVRRKGQLFWLELCTKYNSLCLELSSPVFGNAYIHCKFAIKHSQVLCRGIGINCSVSIFCIIITLSSSLVVNEYFDRWQSNPSWKKTRCHSFSDAICDCKYH